MADALSLLGGVLWGLAPIALPFLLFGIAELYFPAHRLKSRAGWGFNLKVAALYLAVPSILGGAMAALIMFVRQHNGGGLVDLSFGGDTGPVATIAGVFLFLLIFDFFYYCWHRAQHEWKPLWAIHKLHHMDETLGVSTQLRCHWLEEIGRIPFIFVPMALLFNLPLHAGAVAFALTFWTGFVHANLRLDMGRWTRVIAGPQVHRIHHSSLPQHFDRNYAAMFPIFDILFGTYHHPAKGEFPPTGVRGEPEPASLWRAASLPFVPWMKQVRGQR